jgi:hypothetical protein
MMVFKSVITIILCYCLSQELVNAANKCQTVPTAGGTPTPGEFLFLFSIHAIQIKKILHLNFMEFTRCYESIVQRST